MSILLSASQTDFVFGGTFDFPVTVNSTVSGKVFFLVSGGERGGIDILPMVVVSANTPKTVSVRVYKPGLYLVYAKQNNNGIFEESNYLQIRASSIEEGVSSEIKKSDEEKKHILEKDDGTTRPSIFWTDKEKNFHKQVVTEVVERIVNEYVLYFPIRVENYHPLYGESAVKFYDDPIRLPCIVEWKGNENKNDKFSFDIVPTIVVHVLKRRVEEDLGLKLMVGDFVQYGRDFFEIVSVENPTKLFYSFNLQVEADLTCVKSRTGVFFLEPEEKKNGD